MIGERPSLLIITPDFPPARGGIQLTAHRLASRLRDLNPTVVTLAQPDAAAFDRDQPFQIHRVPELGVRSATILGLNAAAVALAWRRRPAVVLSMHVVTSPAAVLLARRLGVRFVQYVHGHEFGVRPRLARFAVTNADRVVAVSRYTLELTVAVGVDRHRIALVHPGVDLPPSPPAAPAAAGPPTVLTIARIEERYKGHDVILRALPLVRAKLPDVRWRVVGDGPLRPMLADRCATMGLSDAVRFLGTISDAARDEELTRADVFCMVSRLQAGSFAGEGFGIVYLEAGAHQRPVVAGAVGGAPDAVIADETGLLVDPEDHFAVAQALVALLTDLELRERMGRAGRARAERLSWSATAAGVESELLGLVA